jgi:hypothetical protein
MTQSFMARVYGTSGTKELEELKTDLILYNLPKF